MAARLELGGGLGVVLHGFSDVRGLAVGGAVADHHIAAGCERIAQLRDEGGRDAGAAGQEVEYRDEQEHRRLGQVEQVMQSRMIQNCLRAAQVGLDRGRAVVAGEDGAAVQHGDLVCVDVDDAGARGCPLGDRVHVVHGRNARTHIEELPDACLPHVMGLNIGVPVQAAPQVFGAVMGELSALIAAGVLTPGPPVTYALADGPKVLAELEARATVGKLALLP